MSTQAIPLRASSRTLCSVDADYYPRQGEEQELVKEAEVPKTQEFQGRTEEEGRNLAGNVFRQEHISRYPLLMHTKMNTEHLYLAEDCGQRQVRGSRFQGYSTGEGARQRGCLPEPAGRCQVKLHSVLPLKQLLMSCALPHKTLSRQRSAKVGSRPPAAAGLFRGRPHPGSSQCLAHSKIAS